MIIRTTAHRGCQPPPEFLLQEFHDAADALERKAFPAQRTDHSDFRHVVKRIEPAAAFTLRNHNATLVPPLELARRNAGELDHLRRCKPLFHNSQKMFQTFPSTNVSNILGCGRRMSMGKSSFWLLVLSFDPQ